jgi:hypothetical protein
MKQRPFLISGFIGLAVIVMSLVNMRLFPQNAPGQIDGIASPIVAFEFAETPADIEALFGPAGSSARQAMVQAMDRGNRADYLYMLLYSAFLFSFAWIAFRQTGQKWLTAGMVLAALALVGDGLENVQLLQITAVLDSGEFGAALTRLHWFTWLKWGSLALYFVLMAGYFWGNGRFGKLIAVVGGLAFLLGLASFIRRGPTTEPFTFAVAAMFLLMIIYSFVKKE